MMPYAFCAKTVLHLWGSSLGGVAAVMGRSEQDLHQFVMDHQ